MHCRRTERPSRAHRVLVRADCRVAFASERSQTRSDFAQDYRVKSVLSSRAKVGDLQAVDAERSTRRSLNPLATPRPSSAEHLHLRFPPHSSISIVQRECFHVHVFWIVAKNRANAAVSSRNGCRLSLHVVLSKFTSLAPSTRKIGHGSVSEAAVSPCRKTGQRSHPHCNAAH